MMYTITRGPSKLVTQRRTGPTQQIDNKINDAKHKQKQAPWPVSDSPAQKLVFNRVNGKRSHTPVPQTDSQGEGYTAAHQDNVNFVYEAWQEVEQRLGHSRGAENGHGPVQYTETSPSPSLKNFVPVDLEELWAQRFLANIVNLS
ncbi:MAPK regulated corepressor interacting protein 2-like [Acipenser ruthenus]|uniref:MAPK regulated corepressor interacting protein 2-like n=1 Tax=Acipenser ruthenus TaxID=7906 RepID=UPI001560A12E|nr:MAPK regulated corepressor interacting protein 2-like [Acipenser ruthenus]